MADLETDGLYPVTWDSCDGCKCGSLMGSPQDASGRGILLTITRGGSAVDLSDEKYRLYFLWLHRQQHVRGCVAMEAVDASAGKFRMFFPSGMIAHEGEAVCSVVLSWGDKTLATPTFSVRIDESLVSTLSVEDGFTLFAEALKAYEAGTADLLSLVADLTTMRDSGEFDGAAGPQGEKGDAGEAGPAGKDGADGISCTHSWSGTVLTVTSASGTSSADLVGPQGPKGETGATGATGAKGDALTFAELTDEQKAELKGEKGDTGDTGATGATGATGPQGPKGDAFTYSDFTSEQLAALKGDKGDTGTVPDISIEATTDSGVGTPNVKVTRSESSDAVTFELAFHNLKGSTGPRGAKGDAGEAGADGTSCKHSWDGTVLTVTSASGTSSADLQGPKGETGATGATGATGPQGPQGEKGADGTTFEPASPLSLTDGMLSIDLSSYATQEWVKSYMAETFPDLSGVSY